MKIGNNEENQELNLKKFPLEKLKILQNISSTTNTNNLNSNIQYFKVIKKQIYITKIKINIIIVLYWTWK